MSDEKDTKVAKPAETKREEVKPKAAPPIEPLFEMDPMGPTPEKD